MISDVLMPPKLQSELQSGALVRPLHRDLGYYFVVPPNRRDRARITPVRNWLFEQAAGE